MTIDPNDILNSILQSLDRIDYIRPDDIPNIDLYMDQVTTFMESQLGDTKRHDEDKILTKTMINNYAKNDLLPPPVRKKYSKDHLLLMIFIYYFKNLLSINDIEKLLNPISKKCFAGKSTNTLEEIYSRIFSLEKDQVGILTEDIVAKFNISKDTFQDSNPEDEGFLQLFTFICMLSFDVYVKKLMIEKLIDILPDSVKKKDKTKN